MVGFFVSAAKFSLLLRLSATLVQRDACFFYFIFSLLPMFFVVVVVLFYFFLFALLQNIIPLGVGAVSLSYGIRDPAARRVKSLPCPARMNKAINNSASSGSII